MIDLTPLEVRHKKHDLRRAFRGYDMELVNDFLDLVADRMEELLKRNLDLTDRVESLDRDLEAYREKERSLTDALLMAQQLKEDTREHADREAELIVREARLEADTIRQGSDKALVREEETLRQVRSRRAQLVASFRQLLQRELAELETIQVTLELEDSASEQLPLPEPELATARRPEPSTGASAPGRKLTPEASPRSPERSPRTAAPDAGSPSPRAPDSQVAPAPSRDVPGPLPTQGDRSRDPRAGRDPSPSPDPDETARPVSSSPDQETRKEGDSEDEDWLSSLREGIERE